MRTKFWSGVGVLASIVAGVGTASAADMAVPVYKAPVYKAPPPVILSDWAGFYIGVHGGYGWADSVIPAFDDPSGTFFDAPIKQKGGVFGGHAGYNWQYGSVVTGLEIDFDGADITGTSTNLDPAITLKTDELASARARLGYLVLPNLLAYGTAGLGWGHTAVPAPDQFHFASGATQFGWTAGAGLEYKFLDHWIARAEYLHYDFERASVTGPVGALTEKVDVVRGGVSYKF